MCQKWEKSRGLVKMDFHETIAIQLLEFKFSLLQRVNVFVGAYQSPVPVAVQSMPLPGHSQ